MRLYIAGSLENMDTGGANIPTTQENLYFLESFYAKRKWEKWISLAPLDTDRFMLDSGAFVMINSGGKSKIKDLDGYIVDYIDFIKTHKIKLYVEMDIDKVIGLEEVHRIRAKLHRETGIPPIPVMHKHLGKDYFIELCKSYPYISLGIGPIKSEPFKPRYPYEKLHWFTETAHKYGTKIHGLGFTAKSVIADFHFDSVDSTSWMQGAIYGHVYHYKHGKLGLIQRPQKSRIKDRVKLQGHNLKQWILFQKYLNLAKGGK